LLLSAVAVVQPQMGAEKECGKLALEVFWGFFADVSSCLKSR
jgi:hypothetical protein